MDPVAPDATAVAALRTAHRAAVDAIRDAQRVALAAQRARALELAREAPRCYARTRAGGLCQNPACVGRRRCRMHGGRSLSGPAHPRFRHGRGTAEARAERRFVATLVRQCAATLRNVGARLA